MKILILSLLALAASVFLALMVQNDNGYMLIGYGEWTIEGSLAFFMLMNLVVFAVIYFLLRFISRVWAMPDQIHSWRIKRGARRSRKALSQGLMELSEGSWKHAERNLIRFAGNSETPMLNYLAAARSAQQQGAYDRRDEYLQLAHESMPSADVAVGLTQAELQLEHHQMEQALATLKHLRGIAPRHTHVLKLLKELYEHLDDWQALGELLPDLKKQKVIDRDEQKKLEFNLFHNQLTRAAQDEDPLQLHRVWKSLPRQIRLGEEMVTIFVNYLINRQDNEQVEKILREAINQHWSDDLVELYGRVISSDSPRQLTAAEDWLTAYPKNPVLLFTLGRLCLQNKLWGKARSYLEASIGIGPSASAYRELGALLERMGEQVQAMICFKSGLELKSDTPLLELPASLNLHNSKLEAPMDVARGANPPKLEIIAADQALPAMESEAKASSPR
ncbi:heme biosynthesis protein HemY [Candidatus Vondammii sp. HM_W22]|uniref:heme biosynthesis protein HemY n=1 Tax=Candidatus Vondammii sp. HM_W22 TaxID=2687299 RepID=UPI001F12F375|nr:heme biosynthesis protein HemY [Candidatus Vondammii sp. HM_W22]